LQQELQTFKSRMTRADGPAAVELYRHALAAVPDDFQIHGDFAKLLTDTGNLTEAAAEWQRVKDLLPGRPGPALYLGKTWLRLGKYSEAEAALREVIQLRPDVAEAWDDLAQALNKQKRLEESIQACRHGLQIAPGNAVLHLHLADALAAQGKRPEAVAHLEEAIRCRPNYSEARYLLGVEYAVQEHFAQACDQFARVVQERPQFAAGHLNFGVALVRLNQLNDALREFQTVTHLEPTNRTALEYITRLQALIKGAQPGVR
jgi:protein O-GlcNAc transferase